MADEIKNNEYMNQQNAAPAAQEAPPQYPAPQQGQMPPAQYPPPQGQPGQYPPPQGQYPPPQGQYPPPQGQPGQYPPPQGQYPPPQGQYPPPQGQYPPPQAQYPPPQGGQYPPPQGQYPPPQGGQYPPPPPGAPQQQQQWMAKPTGPPGCPPGLEYLTQIDQVLVQQTVELLEAFTGWETANRYVLRNSMSQQIYYAAEESDLCARQCCAARRGFVMHITDNLGQEVIRATRDFKCFAGAHCLAACDAFQMTMTVESPPGQVVGSIRQELSCLPPKFNVCDANGDTILQIEGPACMLCPQFCEQKFDVMTPDGQIIGDITKQFSGLVRELYTTADNFGVKFPMDLSVTAKATLLGAVFLIDFMYFEEPPRQN